MDGTDGTPASPLGTWPRRHPWLTVLGFALLYAAAAAAGRATRLPGSPLALVWPAAAVGFVWVASSWGRWRRTAGDLLALAAVTAVVNLLTGAPPHLCLVFAAANCAQAAGTCWVMHRLQPQAWRLRSPGDLTVLVAACTAGSVVSSLIGPVGMWLTFGGDLLPMAGAWALRQVSSTFVFSALALRLADGTSRPTRLLPSRLPELVLATAVLSGAYASVFGSEQDLPLAFLLVPLSMWVALRFGTTVAAAHVLLVGSFVVLETLAGNGPFALADPASRVLLAQSYVAISGLVALSLALFRDDRAGLVARLEQARTDADEQAATLSTFLDTVDVGVVACDAQGRLTLFNRATREFHGMPEDPSLDPSDWADRYDLYAEDGRTLLEKEQIPLYRALVDGEVHDTTMVISLAENALRIVRCDGRRLVDAQGRTLGAVVAMKDVTDARRAARALEEREQRFRAAFYDSPTPIAYLGLTGAVQDANAALRRFLGVSTSRLLGTPLSVLVHPDDQDVLLDAFQGEGTGQHPVEVRLRRADGTSVWCELATTRSATPDGNPYLLAQLMDVNARKQHEHALEAAAHHDPLTGLPNRTALDGRLGALLDSAGASADAGRGPVATVLFLDLDGFKAVNDTYGHEAGDAVLVEVATRLLSAVRPGDLVARLGGDEFVVVCPAAAPASPSVGDDQYARQTAALVERLEQAVSAPVVHQGFLLSVGASIGAVAAFADGTPQDVMDDADRAMYRRKKQRRHHPVPSSSSAGTPSRSAGADGDLASSIATAVADGRFRLLYQPVYDLHTRTCVGAEALLRMVATDGSTVTPDRFIPVAETHGHIAGIGRWVITEALGRAAAWKRGLPRDRDFLIGVNVSTLQLNDPHLVAHVQETLARTGLEAGAVGLEITESRLLPDTLGVHQVLSDLHDLGVRVTIDDFGTGFANLGYLATFPFDTIKIDRKYVSYLTEDSANGRLAQGVFALARSTGMDVIAEGVETQEERDAVLTAGCHLAQGFLFARPLTEPALQALLADTPVDGHRAAPGRAGRLLVPPPRS